MNASKRTEKMAWLVWPLLPLAGKPRACFAPTNQSRRARHCQQSQRRRQILKTSLVDLYLPACVDPVNGGYLEALRDCKFAPTGEKFLTLQGRQLWFFSTLAREGIETESAGSPPRSGLTSRRANARLSVRWILRQGQRCRPGERPAQARLFELLRALRPGGLLPRDHDTGALNAAQALFRVLKEPRWPERRLRGVLLRGLATDRRPEGALLRRRHRHQNLQHTLAFAGGAGRALPCLARSTRAGALGRTDRYQHQHRPPSGLQLQH